MSWFETSWSTAYTISISDFSTTKLRMLVGKGGKKQERD
jgi:hypothetical protein